MKNVQEKISEKLRIKIVGPIIHCSPDLTRDYKDSTKERENLCLHT